MYCSACNQPNPIYEKYCTKCGLALDGSGGTNPVPKPEPIQIDPTLPIGSSFWIRFLARFIDLVPHYVAIFFSFIPAGILLLIYAQLAHKDFNLLWRQIIPGSWFWYLFAILGSMTFHVISEGLHGASLGKLICGIAVMSEDKKPCSMRQALGRSAAYYIDGLFFGAIAAMNMSDSQMKQRLGDKWCRTVVCKRRDLPDEIRRSGWRFFGVFCLAFWANAFIQSIGLVIHVI